MAKEMNNCLFENNSEFYKNLLLFGICVQSLDKSTIKILYLSSILSSFLL